jgi:hypothetical protein
MARHKQVTTCRKTGGPLSDRCSCEHCALAVCSVCCGFEGGLTTDCSRETLSFDRQKEIYETNLDYVESRGWHQGEPMQRRTPLFEGRPPHRPIMSKYDVPPGHVVRIVGCECGWTVPDHEKNSDDFWDRHVNAGIAKVAPSASTFVRGAPPASASGAIGHLHAPTFAMASAAGFTRISGCSCGWTVPAHEQNSDTAWSEHAAIARAAPPMPTTPPGWRTIDHVTTLKDVLARVSVNYVVAKRIYDDCDAVQTRVQKEVDEYQIAHRGQDPNARSVELLQKLEWAKSAVDLADLRLTQCDDDRERACEKLVDALEKPQP